MWNDIRFGARMLVKTPAFTIITGSGARARHRRVDHDVFGS